MRSRELTPEESTTPINSEKWNHFFEHLHKNIESPDLIWNASTRAELIFCIREEINQYDREKAQELELSQARGHRYVWNYEEFSVPYNCVANELKIGSYYINLLLKQIPNVQVEPSLPHFSYFVDSN